MEAKYCRDCLYAKPLSIIDADLVECKWASQYIDKVFDVTRLKPSNKRYIFCNIDNKTGEGHLVVKLDFKFKTKTMLPDAIYSMTLQELLDMEEKENE